MRPNTTRPMKSVYDYHVTQADLHERRANKRRDAVKFVIAERNPRAGEEWVNKEASNDARFKELVATQQFHVRQATMYGLGALMESMDGLVAEIRAFGHQS